MSSVVYSKSTPKRSEGKRQISIDFTPSTPKDRPRRYIEHPSSKEYTFRPSSRSVTRNGSVIFANKTTTNEYDLGTRMGRKRRSLDIGTRNGIGESTPGDKPYGSPQNSKDYYKRCGMIPGSTIRNWPKTHSRNVSLRDDVRTKLDFGSSKTRLLN